MSNPNAARVQDSREEQAVKTLKANVKKPKQEKVKSPKAKKSGKKSFKKAPDSSHITRFLNDYPEYTHEMLAEEIGVHATSISNWLSDNYTCPLWTVGNIENLRRKLKSPESRKETFIVQTDGKDQAKIFKMMMDQMNIKTREISL